jgi:hypothetical protein
MNEPRNLTLGNVEIGFTFAKPFHSELICLFVALRSGGPNRWPFLGVEHAKLQAGHVSTLAHLATERIDFPGEMSLGQATNCRIAGHLPYGVSVEGQHECLASHASRSQGCLNPGMPAANHNHVIFLGVTKHELHRLKAY